MNERFPSYVRKTNETRLQNHPEMLQQIKSRELIACRKEDGIPATYSYYNGTFLICSKNYALTQRNKNTEHYFAIADKFHLQEKLTKLNRNIALQGEIIGPRINGNKLQLKELIYHIVDIWNIDEKRYMILRDVMLILHLINESLNYAPFVCLQKPSIYVMPDISVEFLLEIANQTSYAPGVPAKGLVIKTNDYETPRYSFKVISAKY